MNGATLNPLVLVLIGAPTLAGLYFRMTRWNPQAFRINLVISGAIMAAVAVGYAFVTFERLHPFFESYSHLIVAAVAGIALAAVLMRLVGTRGTEAFVAIPFLLILFWLAAYIGSTEVPARFVMPAAALILFCGLGIINAALGPLAIGLSISATLHACIASDSFQYVMLWEQLFDLLQVSQIWLKLMLVAATCLAASGDVLAWLAERLLDGNG